MTEGLDLHTVRIIRAIADAGSITAAAEALGYSQPALSQHLRRAEHRLGVPLVLRIGRSVQLTEAGQVVARHSGTILAALAAADSELGQVADRTTGTVRMAGFPSASSTIVPALMARLAADYPGLKLHYTEAEPPEALALLSHGSIDIALTFSYPGDPSDPHSDLAGVSLTELFADPMRLVLPAGHPHSTEGTLDLADFHTEKWIAGCPLCRGHLLAACGAQGFSPRITHATDNSVAVLGLVSAGVGIALQPQLALERLDVPDGTSIHPVAPDNDRRVRAAYLVGSAAVPAIDATLTALQTVTAAWRDQPSQRNKAS